LAYAHDRGVLHRDIKPANVLVAADGTPKLADFNISFSSKVDGATAAAYFGGSLAYMSPEQLEAADPKNPREVESLDGRSDIYSLGVMLWEVLTGSRPFVDDIKQGAWSQTLRQLYESRAAGVPPEAQGKLPAKCPPGLKETLLKCLTVDLDERFQTAEEVSRQFELCLQPRAQRLLNARPLWRRVAQTWPILTVIMVGITPNAVTSYLNITYNLAQIIEKLGLDLVQVFKSKQIPIINSVAYIAGVAIVLRVYWPLFRAMNQLASKGRLDPPQPNQAPLRERCLHVGDVVGLVTAGLWFVSGFAFMMWLEAESSEPIDASDFWHFVVSQCLWGLIAATLSFFLVTTVGIRVYYTRLVSLQAPEADEAQSLGALSRRLWVIFGFAAAVPAVAVMLFPFTDIDKHTIAAISFVGLLASGASYFLALAIRGDLAALATMINPSGGSLAGGSADLSDSFRVGSR
jgi:hypothetical protein